MAVQHALSAVELSVWMWPVCADTPGSTSSKSQKLMKLMFHPPDANWKREGGGGGELWLIRLCRSLSYNHQKGMMPLPPYETTDI